MLRSREHGLVGGDKNVGTAFAVTTTQICAALRHIGNMLYIQLILGLQLNPVGGSKLKPSIDA